MESSVIKQHKRMHAKMAAVLRLVTSEPYMAIGTHKAAETIQDCMSRYMMSIAPAICNDSMSDYNIILTRDNYCNTVDVVLRDVIALIESQPCAVRTAVNDRMRGTADNVLTITDTQLRQVHGTARNLLQQNVAPEPARVYSDRCKCGSTLDMYAENSIYSCPECGEISRIEGTVFRAEQCYAQDGAKARNNDYSAMKHYYDWMPQLLGTETKEIDADIVTRIREVIVRDKLVFKSTCREMRRLLKDPRVNATHLNDHTTKLIRLVGGVGPPSPTPEQQRLIESKYRIIIGLYAQVAHSRANMRYCPYFIYRIIEIFFPEDDSMRSILRYIHLQSDKTLRNNDEIFRNIVEKSDPVDGFRYFPIDPESL